MGKSFKGFSKALSLILAVAMVVTCVPTSAYAAELISDDSEDILLSDELITEEGTGAGLSDDVDTFTSDDDSSIDIRKDSSSSTDDILNGNTAGEEEDIGQDKSTGDVTITLTNNTGSHVTIYNPDSENGAEEYENEEGKSYALIPWDSTDKAGFSFTLTPDDGYVINETVLKGEDGLTVRYCLDTTEDEDDREYTTVLRGDSENATGWYYSIDAETGACTVYIKQTALANYKAAVAEADNYAFYVDVPESAAKAATYKVVVIGMEEENYPEVSYDADDKEITLSSTESDPITDVELYTRYVSEGSEENVEFPAGTSNENWSYDSQNKKVTLKAAGIKAAYEANKGLTIVPISRKFSVSANSADAYENTFKFTQYQTEIEDYSSDYEHDVVATLNTENATDRTIKTASVEIKYDDGTGETYSSDDTGTSVKIDTSDKRKVTIDSTVLAYDDEETGKKVYAKSVVVSCTTQEKVVVSEATGTNIVVKDIIIDSETNEGEVNTGTAIKFTADVTGPAYILGDVGYKLGDSDELTVLEPENGVYTIDADKVTNKVTIVAKAEASGKDRVVKLATDSASGFTVTDEATGATLDATGQGYAKTNTDYTFVVTSATDGNEPAKVAYKIGDAGEEKDAAKVAGKTNTYKVPADDVTGFITISVKASEDLVLVKVPTNKAAVVWVNGTAKTSDFYIEKGKDFAFTVKGAEGNGVIYLGDIKVVKGNVAEYSGVAIDSHSDHNFETKETEWSATINKGDLSNGLTFFATTREIVDPSTYSLTFTIDSNGAYEEDEGAKKLLVAQTETATLTPALTMNNGMTIAISTDYTAEYASKTGLNSIIKVAGVENSVKADVQGMSQRSDALKATLTSPEEDYKNQRVYSGELDVTVKPHYLITFGEAGEPIYADTVLAETQGTATRKAEAAKADTTNNTRKDVAANVVNGATGAEVTDSIDFAENAIVNWTTSDDTFYVTKGSKTTAASGEAEALTVQDFGARIAATAPGTADISMSITDADGTVYSAAAPISVEAVKKAEYALVTTLKFDDGVERLVSGAYAESISNNPPKLTASPGRTATVRYRVLEVKDNTIVLDDLGVEGLNAALEAGKLDDITKEIADKDIDFRLCKIVDGMELVPVEPEYLTATPTATKGEYKVSVSDKGDTVVLDFSADINGIDGDKVESTVVRFAAIKSAANILIGIKTNDDGAAEGKKAVTLPESYLNGKKYTRGYDAEPDNAEDGYSFKVAVGSTQVLPAEPEHSDKSRVLLGWKYKYGSHDSDVIYYAPEQELIARPYSNADENLIINPVWANRIVTDDHGKAVASAYRVVNENKEALSSSEANNFSVNLDEETGLPLGLALKKNILKEETLSNPLGEIVVYEPDTEEFTPEAAKVEWKAYDYVEGETPDKTKLTVIDKTALAEGIVKGSAPGQAKLYAVYTDNEDVEWTTAEYTITVSARPTYEVKLTDLPESVNANQVLTVTDAVKIYNGTTVDSEVEEPKGTIEWTYSEGEGNATVETEFYEGDGDNTIHNRTVITGINKDTTVKLTATYTDENGISSAASATVEITVDECPYKFSITNDSGVSQNNIEVMAGSAATNKHFYVTIWDKENEEYVEEASDKLHVDVKSTIFQGNGAEFQAESGDNNYVYGLTGLSVNKNLCDEEEVAIAFFPDTSLATSSHYRFTAPVKNYYSLTLDGSKSVMITDNEDSNFTNEEKYKVGINEVDDSEVSADGMPAGVENNTCPIKLYAKNFGEDGKYILDLTKYEAEYTGTVTNVTFEGWTDFFYSEDGPIPTTADKVKTSLELEEDDFIAEGSAVVPLFAAPQFKCTDVTLVLSNEAVSIEQTSSAGTTRTIDISTTPTNSNAAITVTSDVVLEDAEDGFFLLKDANANPTSEGNVSTITLTPGTTDSVKHYSFTVTSKPGMAGTAKLKVASANDYDVKEVTVNIYGLYVKDGKTRYVTVSGNELSKTAKEIGNTTYYFDADGNAFESSYSGPAWDEEGKLILLADGSKVTVAGYKENADAEGNAYYLDEKGYIVTADFVKDSNDVQRYADSDGVIITYAMTADTDTPGKYTDPVTQKAYVIDKDTNETKFDHDHVWKDEWDWAGTNEYNYNVKVTISCVADEATPDETVIYTESSEDESRDITVERTVSGNIVTYTAKTTYSEQEFTNAYEVTRHEHKWTLSDFVWPNPIRYDTEPMVTAEFTCSESEQTEVVKVVARIAWAINGEGTRAVKKWTATVSQDPDGNEFFKTESEYVKADGSAATQADFEKAAAGAKPGSTPSEPAESGVASYKSYNLFLTDNVIAVPGLADALGDTKTLSGKAAQYYDIVTGQDAVKLKTIITSAKDRKAAAGAANSLITVALADGGVFTYQLPVYYQKPALKLTSSKGTVNISKKDTDVEGNVSVAAQTFTTTVTEKKSTGAYEALDLDGAEIGFIPSGKNPALADGSVAASVDVTGGIEITANARTAGKISVKLADWSEPVLLNYTIAQATKNVLTGSAKKIFMNNNVAKGDGDIAKQEAQDFTLLINGSSTIDADDPVSVIYPSKWGNSGLELTNGADTDPLTLTSGEIEIGFKDGAAEFKKGNYTVKFQTGSGKTKSTYSLTIAVSDLALKDKAVNLKTQAKMDLTTGQKMVLIPQLKGISGEISDVIIDETSEKLFDVEYNAGLNQIYLTPEDGAVLSVKTKYDVTVSLDVAGVTCTKAISFKPVAKKPAVKIAGVGLNKTKLGTDTLTAYTNVLATYKVNGKTFSIAPLEDGVTFINKGTLAATQDQLDDIDLNAADGWFLDGTTKAFVRYNADEGKIDIVTTKDSKKGSIKVKLIFNGGVIVNKSFSINAVK